MVLWKGGHLKIGQYFDFGDMDYPPLRRVGFYDQFVLHMYERWGAGVEYPFQEFNEPYAPS